MYTNQAKSERRNVTSYSVASFLVTSYYDLRSRSEKVKN